MTTLLETIMHRTPTIRYNTVTFKNAVIRYTIELVHILGIRHGFSADEAVERLYPGYKDKQFGRYIDVEFLKENTIRNFKELMLRQPEIADSNKYCHIAVLSYSHSIIVNLSIKYNYPPKIYEHETFEDIGEPGNPDQDKIKEILRKVVEKEDLEYETEDEEIDDEKSKIYMLELETEYLKRENNCLKTTQHDLETDNTDMQEEIDAYKEQNYVLKKQIENLYNLINSWEENYNKLETRLLESISMKS